MPLRKLSSIACRFLLAVSCLLVASCFDAHEELWVNADGSARAEFVYHIPRKALLGLGGSTGLERQVRELVATQPDLRLDSLKIDAAGDDIELAAHLSTDSLLWLRDIKKNAALSKIPESSTDFAGVFKVKLESLKVDFSRTLDIGHALGLSSFLIGQEDREKRHFYCVIHLPLPAIESNATHTEDGGRTLIWDTPLGEALKGPVVTRFRAPVPLPRWLAPAGAGAVALLGLISWQVVRRWRRWR